MEKPWWVFVGIAGLCWGTYIPLVAQGGKELKSSYGSFLCVGVAYFLIAVLFPLAVFVVRGKYPDLSFSGITFATLAGVAGALGALCVIFATFEFGGPRIYVGPVIFALAPVINTLVSLFWHPDHGSFYFGLPEKAPHWTLYVGIVLAGLGAGLVLFAKEYPEWQKAQEAKSSQAGPRAPSGPVSR